MSEPQDDRRSHDGTRSDAKASITKTTAAFSGTATGAIAVIYTFTCVNRHQLITPSIDQALAMLAVCGPFLHLIGRIIMAWTEKLMPKDAST